MAKLPQWKVTETGEGGGPMIVEPRGLGAPGEALAGLGQTAFRVGGQFVETQRFLTAEGKDAERRTRELRQAASVDDFRLKVHETYNQVRRSILEQPEEAEQLRIWAEFKGGIQQQLSAIPEEPTRLQAQSQIDTDLIQMDQDVATLVQAGRVHQAQASLTYGREATIRLRDTSLYKERLTRAAPILGWSERQIQDEFDTVDLAVSNEIQMDRIAQRVSTLPYDQAVEFLNQPGTWYNLHLSPPEKQKFLDQQMGLLTRQQAQAAQEARAADSLRLANGYQLIGQAAQGKPVDLIAAGAMVEKGQLTPEHFRQVTEMVKAGSAQQDNLAILQESYGWLRRVRENPALRDEALTFVTGSARHLKAETAGGLVRDLQLAGLREDPASRIGVKVANRLMDEHYDLGTFGDVGSEVATRNYLGAKQEFSQWSIDNPNAADAEITAKYQSIIGRLKEPTKWQRFLLGLLGRAMSPVTGVSGPFSMGRVQFEVGRPPSPLLPSGQLVFKLTDPMAEPLTLEEFYKTYKSLPKDGPDRDDYWNKWVGKWR